MTRQRIIPSLLALCLVAAACAPDSAAPGVGGGGAGPAVPPAEAPLYATVTVVIDAGGPVACVGGIALSLPPQCGGVPLIGFDWADVTFQDEGGVRFTNGDTYLEGHFVDDRFEVTLARDATDTDRPVSQAYDFSSPCEPPDGGWVIVDPGLVDDGAIGRARSYIERTGELSALWVTEPQLEMEMRDPARTILNVAVLDNVEEHEAAIREIYGGPLCVVLRTTSADQLRAVQADLTDEMQELGISTLGADELRGVVSVGVTAVDPALEAQLAERFGEGVIEFDPQFWRIDG
jgi:hypothetical protein